MNKQAKQQGLVHRLVSLTDQPQEQIRSALELLKQERGRIYSSASLPVEDELGQPFFSASMLCSILKILHAV